MITLQTRVGELLDRWPQAESALLELSPVFAKLQNRMLRRTVAKVATLEQAARVAGIAPQALLDFLCDRLDTAVEVIDPRAEAESSTAAAAELPGWARRLSDAPLVDADALLEAGEHPITIVRRMLRDGPGLCLESSFMPAPLLEQLQSGGIRTHLHQLGTERYRTWIAAPDKEQKP